MPLRSVEAATRDDAIAAAREQFGMTARVVGVRRVRSGGVLGFFATERYVAEVAPETGARPEPSGVEPRRSSPAVASSPDPAKSPVSIEERARAAAASLARLAAAADDDPVSELAGLLSANGSQQAPALYTRTSFPRTASAPTRTPEPARARTAPVAPTWPTVQTDDEGAMDSGVGEPPSPSPFTAALARMVAGDRDVRQAVQDALEEPADARDGDERPWRNRPAAVGRANQQAQSGAVHEEPVDQREGTPAYGFTAAPFPSAPVSPSSPTPAADTASTSPREEAVADILRAALAEGQSDEALAGILRQVLAGSSSEAALPVEASLAPSWQTATGAEPLWAPSVAEPAPAVASIQKASAPAAPRIEIAEAAESVVAEYLGGTVEESPAVEAAPAVVPEVVESTLARTASDPAPLPLDATTVMPRITASSGRRGAGLPPVPPISKSPRPGAGRTARAAAQAAPRPSASTLPTKSSGSPLAKVVRLPVAPRAAAMEAEWPVAADLPASGEKTRPTLVATAPVPAVSAPVADVVGRLVALGVPERLLGAGFAAEAATTGAYAALTRALTARLPGAPELPTGPDEVLFLVGPGVETLRAARSLAVALHLDPERVQWAGRGDLAGLAPKASRMTTVEAATDRRQNAVRAGTLTIVAVDAPLRTDAYWMSQMLAIWSPAAVWAVVEATRKPEDLEPWLSDLPRVDALVVQDTDLSADPAAVLDRLATPVALLDGVPATPHRWASLLCERLEKRQA